MLSFTSILSPVPFMLAAAMTRAATSDQKKSPDLFQSDVGEWRRCS